MNTNINAGQHRTVTLTPLDANEALGALLVNSIPTWSGAAPLVITPAADGLSAEVAMPLTAAPGTYSVNVSGQNPSSGSFTSTFTVTAQAQPATHFGFAFGPVS